MTPADRTPIGRELVLVGGGHAHVQVLRRLGMRPAPGVRVTLVSRELHTPYSGMLPGLVAGHYAFDDAHIDLAPLARFAGARLLHDEVIGLEPDRRRVICRGRPPIGYDVLSLDTGSAPVLATGVPAHAVPVKPVSSFHARWQALRERVLGGDEALSIGVVGGGAGGVELLMSARHRLLGELRAAGRDPARLRFVLVTAGSAVLSTHNRRVQARYRRVLEAAQVEVHTDSEVVAADASGLQLAGGGRLAVDEVLWVTNAAAPAWPAEAGLATDADGFVRVDACLQSVSHPGIFAAGDLAAVDPYPRPKSGVFAVRQGPPLTRNLRRALKGEPLVPFRPQRRFLSLIGTGDRRAVASRGPFAFEGHWVWAWKDWIDRRFVARFTDLPKMEEEADPDAPDAGAMRCGGCGAKVGASLLAGALAALRTDYGPDVLVGLDTPDDAAVVRTPPGSVSVQTVDAFRSFIDDPYRFGRIAATHALNDVFAMGATPHTALALVTLPLARESSMQSDLVHLLSGALEVFAAEGTALVGGHTGEGAELTLGFAVNGHAREDALVHKTGAQAGDALILTKPLGTGVLFAAAMQGRARSRWLAAALESMGHSSGPAARCLIAHGVHAMTDVTGFGLAGHLLEMLAGGTARATLSLDALPLLDGAAALSGAGIASTLLPQNLHAADTIEAHGAARAHGAWALCFDPQTAGGLLAAVPGERAGDCVAALREAGCARAAIVGHVTGGAGARPLRLVAGEAAGAAGHTPAG